MATGVVEVGTGDVVYREERVRILSALGDGLDDLTDRAVEAMRAEIPAYAEHDGRFFGDVRDQVYLHYRGKLDAFLAERTITLDDIFFVRAAAARRARAGFALEDYINAFRVGQQVFWAAVVDAAGDSREGHEAAFALATPLMRYTDFASTHAAHAYVEYQQHVVADADRERRDLLEHLLAGELPTRGPLFAAARAYGFGPRTPMLATSAVAVAPCPGVDAPQVGSAAIARAGIHDAGSLVVVRQSEIVAVCALGPDGDPTAHCERLEALQRRLALEGIPLAVGVSTVAVGVAELPRAYREARTALEGVGDEGGFNALTRLSPFQYLTLQADGTARRLVDVRLQAFLDEDRERGRVLTSTIRAFADADLNLRVAAERLGVHPNTAHYRLRRIEERTGCNLRHSRDLLDLLVAMALDDERPAAG